MGELRPKGKAPASARVLNTWIAQAERQLESDGGRLGWLIASTVVAAALQQAVDEQGEPMFLLKGGTLLQHRLPQLSRATTDLDGLIRGDIDRFLAVLDEVLDRPWGPAGSISSLRLGLISY
ncbi:nucleotidyl transferase AbiEii/AbiGii toxin family protein [Microbacterium sp. YY-01]|uniref:nucleotidyl transferase AbiEii/AbiGii toxin family protein n=1 Tax=Microbacterium sp. YY-01 TaxID=3421634 RepID=UPI003D16A762